MDSLEVYEDKEKTVRFYFTHSSKEFTTGVLVIQPHKELPKHNRPLAVENLIQISGKCVMKLFKGETEQFEEHKLNPGNYLSIPKGQYHIHANPFDNISITLFKAEGDITKIMNVIRNTYIKIDI